MYDFYFGSMEEIEADTGRYLLGIKRMLPRWANSLPDSEFAMISGIIEKYTPEHAPVFVETGVGASTILLLYYAMMRGGRVISWDLNSSKASFIRSVCADTLEQTYKKPVSAHWTFVSSSSTAPYTGMPVLGELTNRVDLTIHDSDHTWETVGGEINAALPLLSDGGVVCVDDANQTYMHTYEPIINMTRKKIGLKPIPPIEGNVGPAHVENVPDLLNGWFESVEDLSGGFREQLDDDLYYKWYRLDRKVMNDVGMERFQQLTDRFGAWRVSGRRAESACV